jgi:anti-sigma B factor antagonist
MIDTFQPPSLRVDRARTPDGVLLAVRGELDLASAPILEARLRAADVEEHSHLALDLTGLRFVDATGLRVILNAHRRAARRGGGVTLLNPSSDIRRLLSLTALDLTIDVAPDTAFQAATV